MIQKLHSTKAGATESPAGQRPAGVGHDRADAGRGRSPGSNRKSGRGSNPGRSNNAGNVDPLDSLLNDARDQLSIAAKVAKGNTRKNYATVFPGASGFQFIDKLARIAKASSAPPEPVGE